MSIWSMASCNQHIEALSTYLELRHGPLKGDNLVGIATL